MLGDRGALDRAGITDPVLREAYRLCGRLLVAVDGRSNWAGTLLLPPEKRPHAWAVYALARWADQLLDSGDPQERAGRYEVWRQRMLTDLRCGRCTDPLGQAFAHTAQVYGFDLDDVETMLAAWLRDLEVSEYATWQELRDYSEAINGPPGRMILRLVEAVDARADRAMTELVVALQLANVVRDVGEDIRLGRIYLPTEDLRRFGVTPDELRAARITPRLRRLIRFEVQRARALFACGMEVTELIRPRCRPFVWAVIERNLATLAQVERHGYDIFARPTTLGGRGLASLAFQVGVRSWPRKAPGVLVARQ
ncbi:phytoene/squalene synthase family protein [Streptomyces sp. NRRL S-340]|uniref:phytoene/squalene synthase family protein n=1 Tax=Streptomyces sp. NRRL S-340 TaxID=1463901 RepID=UPI00068EC424|nr:phytoene/squalene synthase family protein [Streptomyces sp. NRRL S-340]